MVKNDKILSVFLNRVVTQIRDRIFVLHHKDIRHSVGIIKILLLENAKMFQLQITLTKI